MRQAADKELIKTVKLESHYYSDHSSVNIIFKNVLWNLRWVCLIAYMIFIILQGVGPFLLRSNQSSGAVLLLPSKHFNFLKNVSLKGEIVNIASFPA